MAHGAQPTYHLRLTPNLSMGPRGFVRVIAISAAFLSLPLLGALGTPVLWGLLPFACLVLWGLWFALQRNSRDRLALREDLLLTHQKIALTRINPSAAPQEWQANPYWVRLEMTKKGAPVENYLTLEGAGRVVELGAFLSPEEREGLFSELSQALQQVR
ncbi:MAG: DUF2244 domain-containing protein [Roseinatronobacter sp.]